MINFKITNAEVSDELRAVAENKLSTLSKYVGEDPTVWDVEFEKVTNHHQQGAIFRIEINLEKNGKLFRAEATAENFEKAIDDARADLEQSLKSERGKREALWKKGARMVKERMRWGR